MGVVDGINSITKYNPPISLYLIRVPCIPCSLTSSLVQQWRSYCSPSGQGGAGYSSHECAEPVRRRGHSRKVSYVVSSIRSTPNAPKPPFGLGGGFGSLPARNSHSLVSLAASRAADQRDQEISSQVTQYWFDSPTHPHPISFNYFWILLGCTAPAGSFKQITG